MDADESTPIEDVLQVEREHSDEAEQALSELNGSESESPSAGLVAQSPPQHLQSNNPYRDVVEDDMMEPEEETMMDFWIQLLMTAVTVAGLVFLFFSPKVRILLEPVIGTGYVALTIRSLFIGILSLVPRLVLM